MSELKYAYPNDKERSILLSDERLPIRPFFDIEIQIISLDKDTLKGNIVQWGNTKISNIPRELIRDEYFKMKKRFWFFGKPVRKPIRGWVRLKDSYVEIDLKNLVIISHFASGRKDE